MTRQITTFKVGNVILGLDILLIKEVYRDVELSLIPGAPKQLAGLMNLRGKVVTIVDMEVCLEIEKNKEKSDNRLLILKVDNEVNYLKDYDHFKDLNVGEDIVGLMIDSVEEVISIEENEILGPPSNLDSVNKEYIEGVIKVEDDLVVLLKVSKLLKSVLELTNIEN